MSMATLGLVPRTATTFSLFVLHHCIAASQSLQIRFATSSSNIIARLSCTKRHGTAIDTHVIRKLSPHAVHKPRCTMLVPWCLAKLCPLFRLNKTFSTTLVSSICCTGQDLILKVLKPAYCLHHTLRRPCCSRQRTKARPLVNKCKAFSIGLVSSSRSLNPQCLPVKCLPIRHFRINTSCNCVLHALYPLQPRTQVYLFPSSVRTPG